jgi:hypothetical protein
MGREFVIRAREGRPRNSHAAQKFHVRNPLKATAPLSCLRMLEGARAHGVGFEWRDAAELSRARRFVLVPFSFQRGPAHACID